MVIIGGFTVVTKMKGSLLRYFFAYWKIIDIEWSSLLECDLDEGVTRFYSVINESINSNVLDCRSRSESFPVWYTNELKDLINEKKELHAIWKDSKLPRDSREYIEFTSVRAMAMCLRLSRELYNLQLCKIESNINNNLKCFWSYV